MRCNIDCTYCYWFRDDGVYSKPKILTEDAEEAIIKQLKSYIQRMELLEFEIIFHGGEPLLFGKKRFNHLCRALRVLESETSCQLQLSITTNGLLVDDSWIQFFKHYNINVGISLDGNKAVNDTYRVDFKGKGTFDRVKTAIKRLCESQVEPGILAVCHPTIANVRDIYHCFVDELGLTRMDFLIPDATYHDKPASIFNYYKAVFDLWYDHYSHQGIFVTIVESMIRGALKHRSLSNAIGYTPVKTITVLTDGTIEPLDCLRAVKNNLTESPYSVFVDELDTLQQHPVWREVYNASLHLHEKCNSCQFKIACGGGPLQSRWNKSNRFNNPSVYCNDLFQLFEHVLKRVNSDLYQEALPTE